MDEQEQLVVILTREGCYELEPNRLHEIVLTSKNPRELLMRDENKMKGEIKIKWYNK